MPQFSRQSTRLLILAILVLLGIHAGLFFINLRQPVNNYAARDGSLDLRTWDPHKDQRIPLDGEWAFYPDVFIDPLRSEGDPAGEDPFSAYEGSRTILKVPGPWLFPDDRMRPAEGAGTYRLLLRLPEEGSYAIKTGTIRGSANIFMNGLPVARLGQPDLQAEAFLAGSRFELAVAADRGGEMEIVLQVANYHYHSGGILQSIHFGRTEAMLRADRLDRMGEGFVISVCLGAGLYFFLLFLQRRKETSLLYASLAASSLALYLSLLNEQALHVLIPYDLFFRSRCQAASAILITFSFLRFVGLFFEDEVNKKRLNGVSLLSLLILAALTLPPFVEEILPLGVMQLAAVMVMLVSYGYAGVIFLRALDKQDEISGHVFLLLLSLGGYWVTLTWKIFWEWEVRPIASLLILSAMVATTLLMNGRLQADRDRALVLAEELAAQDRIKESFWAHASHELRGPLHAMINLSKQLMEGRKGTLNEAQLDHMFHIHSESRRLSRLVDELMEGNYIREGQVTLEPVNLSLPPLVEQLLKEVRLLIPDDKDLSLVAELPADLPPVRADENRLRQVLFNLLDNAIKFTPAGSVTVRAEVQGRLVKIHVIDTGMGIEGGQQESLFKGRFRALPAAGQMPGFGLGLSVAASLVEQMGGSIGVRSRPGGGSDFFLTLPRAQGEAAEGQVQNPSPAVRGQPGPVPAHIQLLGEGAPYTVLVVDDDSSARQVLTDIIQDMGCRVLTAEKGMEVLPILVEESVDLVVLDVMLPDLPGMRVCKMIRHRSTPAELPILMLTSSGRMSDLLDSFRFGANDFLIKPADGDELRSRIHSLLLMRQAVREGALKEFRYLYSQISPHFLYNTLNTIIALLDAGKGEAAQKALYNLSLYLRGKMDIHHQQQLIPLWQELELVQAYLEIEELRFGDKLQVDWQVEEELHALIPPLSLQSLVENAVRRGRRPADGLLRLSLTACKGEAGHILLEIQDQGAGMTEDKQKELLSARAKRHGFTSSMNRILLIKGATFDLSSQLGLGTTIRITLAEARDDTSDYR